MRYSLVSRFRGTLLGAFLGETLASSDKKQSEIPCNVGKIAVLGTQSLIALGRLDLDDWLKRQQQASLHLEVTDVTSAKIILTTLPVALFFHENTGLLRQNLLSVLQMWEHDPVLRDSTLAVGYAIAQALTEKLDPLTLIPQTIAFLGETSTSIPQQLLKVNNLLTAGAGLAKAQAELSREEKLSNTIAIAFYCFLSTWEDFRLSVLRATHHDNSQVQDPLHPNSKVTGAITGALSGAYNSTVGIPVNWQVLYSPTNSPAWGLSSFDQMIELADALAAVWSGVYGITRHPRELIDAERAISLELAPLSVFAAPRVIRSR
jgi:hypothetical protein